MSHQQTANPAEMYEEYLVPGIHARWMPVLLNYAEPRPGERVLDVACGTGIVARSIAPLVDVEGSVVGLDISPGMLTVARTLPEPAGAAIEWYESDAASLPLPDDAFDLVVCQQGLQFFADRAAAVAEMRRVLAPGERAVLSVFRGLEHHPLYAALIEAESRYLDVSLEAVAAPFTLGDAGALRSLLDAAGFRQVEIMPESQTVRFPSPERFVRLTLLAAASMIPESDMDAEARAELVQAVSREVDGTLQAYVEGDTVAFPMHAHVAVAHA